MPGPNPSIFSIRTGQNAIAPNGPGPGWITGNPAGLAASANVNCDFDLGPNWDQFPMLQIAVVGSGPSSGLNFDFSGASDSTFSDVTKINNAFATAFGKASGGPADFQGITGFVRPMGRFLRVLVANADAGNAVGAGAFVKVTAYPGA